MFAPDPVALPGLAAFTLGALGFFIAVLAAKRRGGAETGATRSRASLLGIVLQAVGIALAGMGRQRVTLDPLSAKALVEAAAIAVLMAGAIGQFVWASRAMGRNWSIVARTRTDHTLVQHGPFAHLRHPIYTGMALFLLALALASGHTRQLIVAAPVFALGTWLRVRIEERLLSRQFGSAYATYAARVKRFVPGLF